MARAASTGRTSHGFNFYGGDILSDMGATWFVSYAYYTYVDKTHQAWKRTTTAKIRIKKYESSFSYHRYWLDKVQQMEDQRLATNRIGLMPEEIKRMAAAVMKKAW